MEVIDKLLKYRDFETIKRICMMLGDEELNYHQLAVKLLDFDLEKEGVEDDCFEAIDLFLWLDLRQCDYVEMYKSSYQDLDYFLQQYIEREMYDNIDVFLNLNKITFNLEHFTRNELKKIAEFYLKDKITMKDEYLKTLELDTKQGKKIKEQFKWLKRAEGKIAKPLIGIKTEEEDLKDFEKYVSSTKLPKTQQEKINNILFSKIRKLEKEIKRLKHE